MAINTVEYWFPTLATLANTVMTDFTPITVYLPESSKVFRSCYVEITVHDFAASAANVTTKTIEFRLGAAGYTTVPWTQTYTASGENITFMMTGDFTAHFTTNWSGTSMAADLRALVTQQAAGYTNVTARLVITYEYDETSPTYVKTVRIPITTTQAALATSKPASLDTIPALNTYLSEAGKTIRSVSFVVEGNQHFSTTVTDITLSMELGSLGVASSAAYERAQGTCNYYRWVAQPSFSYASTHTFHLWANVGACNMPVVTMVVTYEFDRATTTRAFNSVMLPMDWTSPIGIATTDFSTASRNLWIEEPGTITLLKSALVVKYHCTGNPGAINWRVKPNATWTAATNNSNANAGSFTIQMDAAPISLARGRNTIGADLRGTSGTVTLTNVSSYWILNYESDVATVGIHAHNKTILQKIQSTTNQAAATILISADFTGYDGSSHTFRSGLGVDIIYIVNSTGAPAGLTLQAEKRSGATHLGYESIYADIANDDPETGIRYAHSQARDIFRRWTDDPETERFSLTAARKFKAAMSGAATAFFDLTMNATLHAITKAIAGNIANGPAANANAKTIRVFNSAQGLVLEQAIAGGAGSFNLTWFDDTLPVSVVVTDDVTGDEAFAYGFAEADTFHVDFAPSERSYGFAG